MQLASCTSSLQGLTRLRKYYQLEVQLASCTTSWQGLRRLRKYYWLEVQLAQLVDFAQYLLQFASHFTFLYSKSVLHFFESLFSCIFSYFYSVLYLYLYLLGSSENTTGQRYSFLTLLTSLNCYHGLFHILLFCTPNCRVTCL